MNHQPDGTILTKQIFAQFDFASTASSLLTTQRQPKTTGLKTETCKQHALFNKWKCNEVVKCVRNVVFVVESSLGSWACAEPVLGGPSVTGDYCCLMRVVVSHHRMDEQTVLIRLREHYAWIVMTTMKRAWYPLPICLTLDVALVTTQDSLNSSSTKQKWRLVSGTTNVHYHRYSFRLQLTAMTMGAKCQWHPYTINLHRSVRSFTAGLYLDLICHCLICVFRSMPSKCFVTAPISC